MLPDKEREEKIQDFYLELKGDPRMVLEIPAVQDARAIAAQDRIELKLEMDSGPKFGIRLLVGDTV